MRFASICSGIGVAESAWMPLGWQPTFFAEIEPFPCADLEHLHPDVPNLGDMTGINGEEWRGRVDLLAGGTPCQAFSIAGNRKSLADERGNLTLKFVELCDAICPAFIVWENVPGVLSTPDNAFGCFLGALAGEDGPLVAPGGRWSNAGYVLGPKRAIAWRVLDAQYFGVAQRRRRVFLVACPRDGADPREILFESDSVRRDTPPSREARENFATFTAARIGIRSHWEGGPHPSLSQSHNTGGIGMSNQELFSQKGAGLVADTWPAEVATTLNAAFGSKMGLEDQHALGGAGLFVPHVAIPEVSPTIDARTYKGLSCGRDGMTGAAIVAFQSSQSGMRVRRLTPRECERLQGLPDDYTLVPYRKVSSKKLDADYIKYLLRGNPKGLTREDVEMLASDGPRYKALGNAWNRAVAEWLGKRIDSYVKSNAKA